MNLIRNLVIATTWTVIAVGAVVYALVQDHTVLGVISTSAAVVLSQVLYRLCRKAADAVSIPDTVEAS